MLMPGPAKPLNSQNEIAKLGFCELWSCQENLVIDSPIPLEELKLREFARPRLLFRGQCYYLAEKSQSSDKHPTYRYVLAPWPKNDEAATLTIPLEEYLQELPGERRRTAMENLAFKVLIPFYPILGFLWSPQKRVLNRIGLEAQSLSAFSAFLSFVLGLLSGAFYLIFMMGAKEFIFPLLISMLVLLLDSGVRYSRLLSGNDEIPPGFLEWLFRPKKNYQ